MAIHNYNSYTASILIEPKSGYSYPLVSGGLIENFGFNYLYNGQVYSGPGTPVSGTSFYADILQGVTGTNVYITLVNGWGSTGSWSYLFFNFIIQIMGNQLMVCEKP